MSRERVAQAVALVGGLFFMGPGLWAFLGPRSFYDNLATFPPYNEHFLHDVGAFQIGIGVTLLLAIWWRDALVVALAGAGVGAGVHTLAHLLDRDLGGRTSDIVSLAVVTVLLVLTAVFLRPEPARAH